MINPKDHNGNNENKAYDLIIIGGGATGLGVAVEAASRGYSALLLEAHDYGKGTSSKSTKLVHGGIRYLANFDFALVKEGLEERYYFLKNAPHLAHAQTYLIPFHTFFEKLQYHLGIRLYDFLAGKLKIGQSQFLSKAATLQAAPDLNPHHIAGGGIYYDGQFDDTRMLMTLLHTFQSLGGEARNAHPVDGFIEEAGKIVGVRVRDQAFRAKVVINATGTFTDNLLNLAEPNQTHQSVTAAQGIHLVFDKDVFDCRHALVIPKTIDGRILFVLPWHHKIIVGTTDIKVDTPSLDPWPLAEEIDLILNTFNQYSKKRVSRADIRSIFAGQRPLVKPAHAKNTKKISRKHEILAHPKGLISIVGGKWTIYRRMGEDTIDFAIQQGFLPATQSVSKNLTLFGVTQDMHSYPLSVYGSETEVILKIQTELQNTARIHSDLPYFQAEVIYHVRHEQARTLEDILARRTRALFLNAHAAIESAPLVAQLMATEIGESAAWIQTQLALFKDAAQHFLVQE